MITEGGPNKSVVKLDGVAKKNGARQTCVSQVVTVHTVRLWVTFSARNHSV